MSGKQRTSNDFVEFDREESSGNSGVGVGVGVNSGATTSNNSTNSNHAHAHAHAHPGHTSSGTASKKSPTGIGAASTTATATVSDSEQKEEPPQQEVRCLIDNHSVGGIIGKAGAHVKRVREETNVFVSILKSDHKTVKERVMVLKGQSSHIAKAFQLIAEHLVEAAVQAEKKGFTNNTEVASDSTVIKLLVHKSIVGAVIGKGGTVIKETQTETGARVQVSNEPLPNSTEKTISVTGTPVAIYNALIRILVQLCDNPVRSGTRVLLYIPGPPMYPPQLASPYGFAGPYGAPLLYGQSGPVYGGALAQSLRSMSVGSPMHLYPGQAQQAQTRQELPIPTVCAGGIIGKGGSVIRDLRAQSGTNISIADPESNNLAERIVTISGPPQGVQTAIFLIRQLVEQYQPQNNNNSNQSF